MRPPPAPLDLALPPPGFFDDPWPHYRQLRATPVADDGSGGLILSRYAELDQVYRDPLRFASDKRAEFGVKFGESPLFAHHTTSLVFNDEPRHGRVRRRLVGALSPKAVGRLAHALTPVCDALAAVIARQGGGDALEDFAAAVPVRVIGDLLGVPERDRAPLRNWSLAILGALEPRLDEAQRTAGNAAVGAFAAYLKELIAERRRHPGDPETDLLTRLVADGDEPLDACELVHNAIFLLNAGHETTTNLIASGIWRLATDPASVAAHSTEAFVEELLRCESPNQLGNRTVVGGCELGGFDIPARTRLTLVIGSANRDPDAFDDPERFAPGRRPNRHLAFGAGPHQCAGLNLARIEARIALDAWRRLPAFRLAAPAVRQRRVRFRGFERLMVTL